PYPDSAHVLMRYSQVCSRPPARKFADPVPPFDRRHIFLHQCYPRHRDLHSFPTRRSSDLQLLGGDDAAGGVVHRGPRQGVTERADRKSTRLNSSHLVISYAVFCLKKKSISSILAAGRIL